MNYGRHIRGDVLLMQEMELEKRMEQQRQKHRRENQVWPGIQVTPAGQERRATPRLSTAHGSAWGPMNSASIQMQKKERNSIHISRHILFCVKINPQCILDSNVKPQAIKLEQMRK